jgi:molybdenum cofactor synthesis domain-containing protein
VRGAVITLSDKGAAGLRRDESGDLLERLVAGLPAEVIWRAVVPDDPDRIREAFREAVARVGGGLVVSTGGTGLSPRDNTPETVLPLLDEAWPGVMEAVRRDGRRHTPMAALSRGVAGRMGRAFVVTLPGSRKAVGEAWDVLGPLIREMLSKRMLV